MRRAALVALAALPLFGFDCGGKDPEPSGQPGGCTLTIGGEVSETTWCIVTVYDYSAIPEYPSDEFVFMLVAYRGSLEMPEVAAEAGFFLPARALVGVAYGWDATTTTVTSNVDSGSASRYDATYSETHYAMAPLLFPDEASGKVSVTMTRIPAANATNEELLGVDGTLTATLPSTTGGGDVTFTATF